MRTFTLFFLVGSFCLISSCKDEAENAEPTAEGFSFDNISNNSSKQLLSFFNVIDYSTLNIHKFTNEKFEPEGYYIVVEKNYLNTINEAPRLAYLIDDGEDGLVVNYFFQRMPHENKDYDSEKIQISSEFNKEPDFTVIYNINSQYFELVVNQNKCNQGINYLSDSCFKRCIGDELERISNSNWLRQARFLISAPVEFAWIMGECAVDCI